MKRNEYERQGNKVERQPGADRRGKVLVVGSGPAGLAAANDLRLLGYGVKIVEALPVLGGMLAVGIPEFRLPRDILNLEIEGIRALGVEMETNHRFRFDADEDGFRQQGFDVLFLSSGAHVAQDLPAQVAEARGHHPGLRIEVLQAIGEHPRFAALLRDIARDAAG